MSKLKLRLPSPAMVVALIALLAALGGSAYAAKKIGTGDIKKAAVTTGKIKKAAVTSGKIKKAAVKSGKIPKEAITTPKLAHPTFWAFVTSGPGAIVTRNEGAVGVSNVAIGQRSVQFEDNVSTCTYQATGAHQGATGRIANAAIDPADPTRVLVRIHSGATGTATDSASSFNLAVNC